LGIKSPESRTVYPVSEIIDPETGILLAQKAIKISWISFTEYNNTIIKDNNNKVGKPPTCCCLFF
jgi:hypothetical protein